MNTSYFCYIVAFAIVISFGATNAKQEIPFSPIHPGSLHADHFSPLNNDGVSVPNFKAGEVTSLLLDFSSLNSATPVSFDLAGGITFDNQNFEITGAGPVFVGSEVNGFSVEAGGDAQFFGDSISIFSYGGDIAFESIRNDVFVETNSGDVLISGPSFVAEGNFRDGGVNLSSEGAMTFITGSDDQNGNIDFSGNDVNIFGGSGLIASARDGADMFFFALDKLHVDSDGPMNLGATSTLEILSLSGPMNVEAANLDVQSPDFILEATGSLGFSSAIGHAVFTAGSSVNVRSADQVKFTSNEDGVHSVAGSDINFIAGDLIDFSSSVIISTANLASEDLVFDSSLDQVNIHATDNFTTKVAAAMTVKANQDGYITAQNSFEVASSSTIVHDVAGNMVISAASHLEFNGQNGNVDFDIDDDMFIIADAYAEIKGSGIVLTVTDDADFEVHGDLIFEVFEDLTWNFSREATISGETEFDMTSQGTSTITADDIFVQSGDSIDFSADHVIVTTNEGDVTIQSPRYAVYRAEEFSFTGTDSLTLFANAAVEIRSEGTFSVISDDGDIDFSSTLDTSIYANTLDVVAEEDIEIQTGRDLHFFVADELVFANEEALPSTTTFQSGDNFRFEAGDLSVEGIDLNLTTEDLHIFARRGITLESGGDFILDSENSIEILANTDFNMNAEGVITFNSGGDFTLETTNFFHGHILFQSTEGSVNLDIEDDIDINGDRVEMHAGTDISFTSDQFEIFHDESSPTDHGNVIFTSGPQTQNGDFFAALARTIEYFAQENLQTTAIADIILFADSNEDIDIQAGNDVIIVALEDVQFSSSTTEFFGVEAADVDAANIDMSATSFSILADFDVTFTAAADITADTANELIAESSDSLFFTGGSIDVISGDALRIDENGNGSEFNARTSITMQNANMFTTAGDLISLLAKTNKIDLDAVQNFDSLGGQHEISSIGDFFIESSNTIDLLSNDNGFLRFKSGNNIDTISGSLFQLSGRSQLLTTGDGRFGTIRSTASDGHICIDSTDVSQTGFFGDSILFTAAGPNAALNVTSESFLSFSSDASIGQSAYGFVPTDPQFLFEDDVSFGILYRTAPGNSFGISADSSLADLTAYAAERFFISSNTSSLTASSNGELEFRTRGREAGINVVTEEGDLAIRFDDGGSFISGNPLLPSDTRLNATRDVIVTSTGDIDITHLGTTTVVDSVGILLESFMEMSYSADSDFIVDALDGGIYNIETRQGDASFTTVEDIDIRSQTGSVDMISRGESTFTSEEGEIAFAAEGDGGSVFLSSGGEQLFSLLATETSLFFEAEEGEIDFQGTEGFSADVTESNTYDASCINIEGGSVKYDAETLIQFKSDEEIAFDADVEFTVDASTINFEAGTAFSISAGGTGVTPGITIDSIGDIVYDSENGEISFNATNIVANVVDLFSYAIEDEIIVRSTFDSLLRDSISITAQNTGGLFQSEDFVSTASLSQTTSSENLMATIVDSIEFNAARELRFDTEGDFIATLTGDLLVRGGDVDADFNEFIIESTVAGIAMRGDSAVTVAGDAAFDLTSDTFTFTAQGSQALAEINSQTTFTVTGDDSFASDVDGKTQVFANNAISLTAVGDLVLDSFDDILVKAEDSLTLSSQANMQVEAEFYRLNSNSFSAEGQTDTTFTSTLFEGSSFGKTTLDSGSDFTIIGGTAQFMQFLARDQLSISGTAFTSTSTENQRFTSFSDDTLPAGVDIDAITSFTSSTGIFNAVAKNDVIFDFGAFGFDGDNVDLQSSGAGGVQSDAGGAITMTVTDTSSFVAETGNIEMFTEDSLTLTGTGVSMVTNHPLGDIRIASNNDATTFTAVTDITLQQYLPNAPVGSGTPQSLGGLITMKSKTFELAGTAATLEMNSNDDISIRVNEINNSDGSLVGQTIDIEGGLISDFYGFGTLLGDANTLSFDSLGSSLAEIRMLSNSISYSAADLSLTATGESRFVSAGIIRLSAPTTLSMNSVFDVRMIAERDDFNIDSIADTFTLTGDLSVTTTGTKGILAIDSPLVSLIPTGDVFMDAEYSFWAPFDELLPGGDFYAESSRDIVFLGQEGIDIIADDISMRATNNGIFTINSGGNFLNTAEEIEFIARGMLGAIGGRYVLEDSYWQEYSTNDQHRRINRNTNGIEVTNVNGDLTIAADEQLFITSCQGSIEFRAVDTIRYNVPNTEEIWFFGIDGTFTDSAPGVHRVVPFTRSDDYCDNGCNSQVNCASYERACPTEACDIECRTLSTIINDIVDAMVAYGLLECDPTATNAFLGFCETF